MASSFKVSFPFPGVNGRGKTKKKRGNKAIWRDNRKESPNFGFAPN